VIGNTEPTFSQNDILINPQDPTSGTVFDKIQQQTNIQGWEGKGDNSLRRQLRRLNWVAYKLIKKFKNRTEGAINIDALNTAIKNTLEEYQIKVLGKRPEQIHQTYTTREARVIGNLLLPPTGHTPNAKSVFIVPGMDPHATVADANRPVIAKVRNRLTGKIDVKPPVTAQELVARFQTMADFAEEILDTDLTQIIKDIVSGQDYVPEDEPEFEEGPDSFEGEGEGEEVMPSETPVEEEPVGEAVEGEDPSIVPEEPIEAPAEVPINRGPTGVTLRDIINHPRIKGLFNPKAVKLAVKGLVNAGELDEDLYGNLVIGKIESFGSKVRGDVGSAIEPDAEELDLAASKFGDEEAAAIAPTVPEDEENIEGDLPDVPSTDYPLPEDEPDTEEEEEPEEEPESEPEEEEEKDWWK